MGSKKGLTRRDFLTGLGPQTNVVRYDPASGEFEPD